MLPRVLGRVIVYEARILKKWSRTGTRYFLSTRTLRVGHTQKFSKFGYDTKIDKSTESSGNMNFRCNYMDLHFFYFYFFGP